MSTGVYVSVNGCLSPRGPVMNWRLVPGVALPSSFDNLERQLTSVTLEEVVAVIEDGWPKLLQTALKHLQN